MNATFKYFFLLMAVYYFFFVFFFQPFISGDGAMYYASIRSPIIDGDLDFYNDFSHNKIGAWLPDVEVKTKTGLVHQFHAIGSALMNAPFFFLGHFITIYSDQPQDGYSIFYYIFYNIGSVTYSFFGGWITFIFLTKYLAFSRINSFLTVVLMLAATPLIAYTYFEPSYSHAHSYFAAALFVFIWLKFRNTNQKKYWIFMGLCAGLLALIRIQDVVMIVLPILDLLIFHRHFLAKRFVITMNQIAYLGSYFLVYLPQMYFWKIVYGEYIPRPLPIEQYYLDANWPVKTFMDWTSPHVIEFLFSSKHGLFTWHPIFIIAISGFYFTFKKNKEVAIMISIMIVLMFYIHSAPWDWWAGWAFGMRRITDIMPLLSIGLVSILDQIPKKKFLNISIRFVIFTSFITWNILFILIWVNDLPQGEEIDFESQVFPKISNWNNYFYDQIKGIFFISTLSVLTENLEFNFGLTIRIFIALVPFFILVLISFFVRKTHLENSHFKHQKIKKS